MSSFEGNASLKEKFGDSHKHIDNCFLLPKPGEPSRKWRACEKVIANRKEKDKDYEGEVANGRMENGVGKLVCLASSITQQSIIEFYHSSHWKLGNFSPTWHSLYVNCQCLEATLNPRFWIIPDIQYNSEVCAVCTLTQDKIVKAVAEDLPEVFDLIIHGCLESNFSRK